MIDARIEVASAAGEACEEDEVEVEADERFDVTADSGRGCDLGKYPTVVGPLVGRSLLVRLLWLLLRLPLGWL